MVMEGVSFAECGSGPHGLKTMDFEGHQATVGFSPPVIGDRKEGEGMMIPPWAEDTPLLQLAYAWAEFFVFLDTG